MCRSALPSSARSFDLNAWAFRKGKIEIRLVRQYPAGVYRGSAGARPGRGVQRPALYREDGRAVAVDARATRRLGQRCTSRRSGGWRRDASRRWWMICARCCGWLQAARPNPRPRSSIAGRCAPLPRLLSNDAAHRRNPGRLRPKAASAPVMTEANARRVPRSTWRSISPALCSRFMQRPPARRIAAKLNGLPAPSRPSPAIPSTLRMSIRAVPVSAPPRPQPPTASRWQSSNRQRPSAASSSCRNAG